MPLTSLFASTRQFVINHRHNEASGLIAIYNKSLLEHQGWDVGFWIVSDEQEAPRAIAALGRVHDADGEEAQGKGKNKGKGKGKQKYASGWKVVPLRCTLSASSSPGTTDDCEAVARAGGWIYVIGSHYGPKEGPLDPKRHFIARFNESTVEVRKGRLQAELDVARAPFLLHRLVNDALKAAGIKLIARGKKVRRGFIEATRELGKKKGKKWAGLVKPGDRPINVEGCTFLKGGRLLVGLRYPVTAGGHPIIVEVDGIDRLFTHKGVGANGSLKRGRNGDGRAGPTRPEVTNVVVLSNVGSRARPRGVRELDCIGPTIHVITGDLESDSKDSRVLADHPEGAHARSEHFTFEYPSDPDAGPSARAKSVRRFGRKANVEGLALDADGSVWYVHDDKHIRLEYAKG